MNKLEELGIKYGTDKIGKHNYLPVYYDLFKNKRNKVKKVLEIGVGEGAGLRMFRDFFPNAIIYGADNDPKRVFVDPPIQVFKCDQTEIDDLISLINKTGCDIDLVIDDGSHRPSDQIFTCKELLPSLDRGVIYVIEDVAENIVDKEVRVFAHNHKCYVEDKKVGKRYDDRLIIIKK